MDILERIGEILTKTADVFEKALDEVEANFLAMESGNEELMNKGFSKAEMKEILDNS